MALSETQEQILDAVIAVIVRDGIEGASMRTVADEADVSLGLLSYHFDDKPSLIVAAFQHATDRLYSSSVRNLQDVTEPEDRVRAWIRGAFDLEFLEPDYLALRISLWAVARTDSQLAAVERSLYRRYADRLIELLSAARPALSAAAAHARGTDVIVTQNGLWLNYARYQDRDDLERGLMRCEAIAFGG